MENIRKIIKFWQTMQLFPYLCITAKLHNQIMPTLKKIVISDFKNIEFQELEFSPNVNCICGDNGEGKTNLLDAIYYLSMTRSVFSVSDKFIFRHEEESFSLCGTYRMEEGPDTKFAVKAGTDGTKRFKRDDKPYDKLSAHIGVLPIVMVGPTDISLVSESAEERRKFANAVISQMDREYLASAQQYNRLLDHRNKLLKSGAPDRALLGVVGEMMEAQAERIHEERRKLAEGLMPVLKEYYAALSGGREEIGIEYKSDLDKGPLGERLAENLERDIALGFTTAGVHRDDFIFTMDGWPIRKCGSQGQQKSFIVSLKFAQYEIMKARYGFSPILLLDDVFDKLDMGRITNLLGMVAGSDFGQIFITDSNKTRLRELLDGITADRAYFEAVGGKYLNI